MPAPANPPGNPPGAPNARPDFPHDTATVDDFLAEAYARRMKLGGGDTPPLDDLRTKARNRRFSRDVLILRRDALADVAARCIVSRTAAEFLNDILG